MKKWLVYLCGVITGVILVLGLEFLNSYSFEGSSTDQTDATEDSVDYSERYALEREREEMLFKTGEIVNEKSFKVIDVLMDHQALVIGKDDYGFYNGIVYFLIGEEGTTFYDDQIINVANNQSVRMNGTYRYVTTNGNQKTVPRIKILNNQ